MKELNKMDYETANKYFYEKDGVLYWKISPNSRIMVNQPAGSLNQGYMQTRLNGKAYYNHRILFLLRNGYMPENDIDHINGDTLDNSKENLREVSRMCNLQSQCEHKNNTSGFSGVCLDKEASKWRSSIGISGKKIYIGKFSSKLEAALARYTHEQNNPEWHCHERNTLYNQIKEAWPQFGEPYVN